MGGIRALADGFPTPTQADWSRLVEKALKGASAEGLIFRTPDGIALSPLYRDGEPLSAPRAERGPDGAAWDIRTAVAHPDPTEAHRRLLDDLEGGATSAIVTPASAAWLSSALEDVDLHLAAIALDAGFQGPQAAGWLNEAARAAPLARLAFHLDPLTAFAVAGRSAGPVAAHIQAAAEAAARLRPTYTEASLFLATGRAVHEAGGSDAQELAFTAASALAYAKAAVEAGLSVEAAFGGMVVGVSLDADQFGGIAKLRAARLVVGRIAAASGADAAVRIEARSSARMLSRLDPWTNLLRLTAAGFAGAIGGADAIVLDHFTRPLGGSNALARRLARNTQLILMEEAHLARVADPAAGAWFLDAYTRELAADAWSLFQRIEAEGGAGLALVAGRLAAEVAEVRDRRREAVASGAAPMVGVTLHPDLVGAHVEIQPDPPLAPVETRLPGPDDACPPLTPIRLAEPYEGTRP
jgi:methylmalonyl-CoA mutase